MPVVNRLEEQYASSDLTFYRLDANSEAGDEIQRGYGLRGHPSLALVDSDGTVFDKFVGAPSYDILNERIEALLSEDG